MTPLAIFLLGCATVFLGAVQAAFSALMRLSLRLMAERGGRSDRLGQGRVGTVAGRLTPRRVLLPALARLHPSMRESGRPS